MEHTKHNMVLFHGSLLEQKHGVLSFSSTDDDVLVMFHGHAPTPQPSKFWCKPVNDAGLPKRSASADTRIGYQKTQSQLQMKRQQNQIKSMDVVFVCRFCLARVGLEVQSMDSGGMCGAHIIYMYNASPQVFNV